MTGPSASLTREHEVDPAPPVIGYDEAVARLTAPGQPFEMEEVEDIMRSRYWNPAHCDDLGDKMGVAHFDLAYNAGVGRAIRTLQEALNVTADGIYGPHTKAAAQAAADSLVAPYLEQRKAFYRDLASGNPAKYGEYLDGWLNRVDNLEKYLASL